MSAICINELPAYMLIFVQQFNYGPEPGAKKNRGEQFFPII